MAKTLTEDEKSFYLNVANSGGFAEETILPVTTVNRVFEDLETEYPLLQAIGIKNFSALNSYIDSDPAKNYGWGDLFDGITGQVSANFTQKRVGYSKLTAFAVIPNDALELGPEWIESYVRTLLRESYSEGLEYGLINGRGPSFKEPIGLMSDVDVNGIVTPKTPAGTLTFAPSEYGEAAVNELKGVLTALSVDGNGNKVNIAGKVVMVVNPIDAIVLQLRDSIPFDIEMVSSDQMPEKKALFFVKGRYAAALVGGVRVRKFEQPMALEDATLYTMKQFVNGNPKDNKAALLYDLDIKTGFCVETP